MSKNSQREVSFYDMGRKHAIAGLSLSMIGRYNRSRWRYYGAYRKGWYSVKPKKYGLMKTIFKKLFRRD